jgi:hypothetical protein
MITPKKNQSNRSLLGETMLASALRDCRSSFHTLSFAPYRLTHFYLRLTCPP